MIKRVSPFYKSEWVDAIKTYLQNYEFWHEGIISEFEKMTASHIKRKYGLATNSTSSSIFMCLYVWSKMHPDKNEVIIPNWGYPASFKTCNVLGLTPIPVDIDETLCMNEIGVYKALTSKTLAVIHSENNGVIGNPQAIKAILNPNILFIEDCAPSFIQEAAGECGDVSMFSFSPTKPLMAGEGSCIVMDNDILYEKLKKFRYIGDFNNKELSLNFNMSPFLAAFLIPQFDYINYIIEKREWIHNEYKKYINIFDEGEGKNRHGSIMYLSKKANIIHQKLNLFKVENRYKYYPCYSMDRNKFSGAHKVRDEIIDLPINYDLTVEQIKFICDIIRRVESD